MRLIWLDLETTGLDPAEDTIVEIGMVATTVDLAVEAMWSTTVLQPEGAKPFEQWHPRVQEMHTTSGLVEDLKHGGMPLEMAQKEAIRFFKKQGGNTTAGRSPLCGANPQFDRGFLRQHMPELQRCFLYRDFDVRSLTQLTSWRTGSKVTTPPDHRAIADCLQAIMAVQEFEKRVDWSRGRVVTPDVFDQDPRDWMTPCGVND